ncbi:hypothetical protein XENOCAPTIV_026857, partial [Xenoophorus captivus]
APAFFYTVQHFCARPANIHTHSTKRPLQHQQVVYMLSCSGFDPCQRAAVFPCCCIAGPPMLFRAVATVNMARSLLERLPVPSAKLSAADANQNGVKIQTEPS